MADNTLIIKINGSAKGFGDAVEKAKSKTKELEKSLKTVAKSSAIAFAGFAGVIAGVTKAFADYETALVGVGKTTNIEGKKLDAFGKQFQQLASTIPLSTNELLGIAQAAGQLGVSGEKDLLKFTETVAKLGVATDLSGEQAAISLTRILNVTGEGVGEIDKFGSVIVALGNNFAATESEIVRMATEVSRSTAVFGVSSTQAAGLSTALKAVGVQAQLGGSAVGRAFRAIDASIREGGVSLENLSRVTGIAADDLKQKFGEDSTAVFQQFVEGLGKIDKAGGSTTEALAAFGLKGDEILKVLPVLAKNSEDLGAALAVANGELKSGNALNDEAEKAFATLNSRIDIAKNNFTNLAANVGEQLKPALLELLTSVNGILKSFSELDKETLSSIASFLKFGAVVTGIVATVAGFLLGAVKISAVIAGLSAVLLPASVAASAFWVAVTGPIGIAVAGLAAVGAGVAFLYSTLDNDAAPKNLEEINNQIDKLAAKRKQLDAPVQLGGDPGEVKRIDEQIAKLEELRKAKQKVADTGTGDGSLLLRTNVQTDVQTPSLGADAFGIEQQTIPFAAGEAPQAPAIEAAESPALDNLKEQKEEEIKLVSAAEQAKTEKEKKAQEERAAKQAEETAKRISELQNRNTQLKAVRDASAAVEGEEEKAIAARKAELANQVLEAKSIANKQERDLALENLAIQQEDELEALKEKEEALVELRKQQTDERNALDLELRELTKDQQALFDEEDLEALSQKLLTEKEYKKLAAEEQLNRQITARNNFKKDELKFGKEIATAKAFFAKEEVVNARQGAQQLIQLTRSKNDTLKGIGKAAARANAAIATAEGAIKAYTSLSGIPIVGPALGAIAAGALIAFGVEQQQQISAMQTGGFVPPTSGGARDRTPALLEPGELVVPSAIAPNFIQAAGLPDNQTEQSVGEENTGSGTPVISIELQDRAGEMISLEQREGKSLGLIGGN